MKRSQFCAKLPPGNNQNAVRTMPQQYRCQNPDCRAEISLSHAPDSARFEMSILRRKA